MRKLTNEELISVYFAINVHNEYYFDNIVYFENNEFEINEIFESNPYKALSVVGDYYSISDPYFYIFGEDLVSITKDQFVDRLRANETDLTQIYEGLVEQGEFEDFLNFSEDERKLTDDQLEKLFEEVGEQVNYWSIYENDEFAFEELFENPLEAVRAAQYGDYDYTKPYVKVGNDGNLYSMDRSEYLKELREGKDDLLQIYDELVRDGGIEDFLKEEE